MARSSASKSLEARFEILCAAHSELVERFHRLEKKQEKISELHEIDSSTLSRLITKLHDYGYLSPNMAPSKNPLPKITNSGCKIMQFNPNAK